MKRASVVMSVILISLIVSGCTVLEMADLIFDDDCIHRGTVVGVDHWEEYTKVAFEGDYAVTCQPAKWVEPGDWIEARKTQGVSEFEWSQCEFSR